MPTGQEIVNSAFGAYRLALLDATALRWFTISIPAFWRSFIAALLVAPPFALIVALRFDPEFMAGGSYWLSEITSYVLGWIVFPAVMVPVCWALSLGSYYFTYIIAYNWSAVVQVSVILPVVILDSSGLLPATLNTFLGLLVTGALLFYQWFIARTALRAAPMLALAVVVVDLMLGLVVTLGVERLF
ncbi:MAG: hypothetical protein CL569_09215 [Alphaproteobacteria bacterium]|nr:hypothetical protein [Alphaproteobacteria bacterium]|tara:strand:+ start:4150 stop:4710 length:561 start_codon:yes stop_codon:yes gene_type:complete